MATGKDRSRPLITESLIERLERVFELERIVGRDLDADPEVVGLPSLLERLRARRDGVTASPEAHGAHDITNLLQGALEEAAPDTRLNQTVVALGLLLASLQLSYGNVTLAQVHPANRHPAGRRAGGR